MTLFDLICHDTVDRRRFWLTVDYARKHFKEGHRLLEVGSDDGAFAVGFSLVGYDVIALDPETTPYLAQLYQFRRLTFGDWSKKTDEKFEIVHLGEVLEHAEKPDEMMEQACAVCAGKLIVSVPDFQWKGHLRTYTKDQIVKFLEPYMTLDEVHELKPPQGGGVQTVVMGEPK